MWNKEQEMKDLDSMLSKLPREILTEKIDTARKIMSYYHCAILEMETKLNVLNEQFALQNERNPIESIKTRLKSMPSIREKLIRRGIAPDVDNIEPNIYDVAGVRVICSFVDDIYMIADCLCQQDDVKVIEKKDYIKNPKPNGYRSLHLIVEIPIFLHKEKRMMKVEVQLRTIAMEFWANLEHKLRYKKGLSEEQEKSIGEGLSECAEISASLDEKMYNLRNMIL